MNPTTIVNVKLNSNTDLNASIHAHQGEKKKTQWGEERGKKTKSKEISTTMMEKKESDKVLKHGDNLTQS